MERTTAKDAGRVQRSRTPVRDLRDRFAPLIVLTLGAILAFAMVRQKGTNASDVIYLSLCFMSVIVMAIGLHWNRPPNPLPWVLIFVSLIFNASGEATWSLINRFVGDPGSPAWADIFYLGGYAFLFAGLVMLTRALTTEGTHAPMLEALVVAVALTFALYEPMFAPLLADSNSSGIAKLFTIAYPVMDIAALALLARLMILGFRRNRAITLFGLGVMALTFGDLMYVSSGLHDTYVPGGALDVLWVAQYVFFGAAYVHRDFKSPSSVANTTDVRSDRRSIITLGAAGLVLPVVLVFTAANHTTVNPWVAAIAALSLVVLMLRRLDVLLRAVHTNVDDLRHLALHDQLTDLPNREAFREAFSLANASGRAVAVGVLDLDGFKEVNDTRGHQAGDELLVAVAGRLSTQMRVGDLLARIGGDEFGLVMIGLDQADHAQIVGQRLLDMFAEPFALSKGRVVVHASVGIAMLAQGTPVDVALNAADTAMYAAKGRGRNRCVVNSDGEDSSVFGPSLGSAHLADALSAGDLEVHYQPIVRLADGTVGGVEALARWRKPDGTLIAPRDFLPLADALGLGADVDLMVLRRSVAEAMTWKQQVPNWSAIRLGVNFSVATLHREDLLHTVTETCEEAGFPMSQLTVEITETINPLHLTDVAGRLNALRDQRVQVALDDFGTGWSTFAHLRDLPLDAVKIAQTFIDDVDRLDAEPRMLRLIASIARDMGIVSIAEGVETEHQWDVVRALGVTQAQGWYLERAVPPAQIVDALGRNYGRAAGSSKNTLRLT